MPEFNLGPLFHLRGLAEKMYDLRIRPREYMYKKTAAGGLVSHFSLLADPELGAAVRTHRKLQEEKAHLPVKIFKTM